MWLPLSSPTIAEDYVASDPMDDKPELLADFLRLTGAQCYSDQFCAVTGLGRLSLTTRISWNDDVQDSYNIGLRSVAGELQVYYCPPREKHVVSRQGSLHEVVGLLELIVIRLRLSGERR
jgi:hypothetical protein